MVDLGDGKRWPDVNEVVEAFESALARDGEAEVDAFEPPSDHPDRLAILCELVRVDLEVRRDRGEPRRLEEYLARFPHLAEQPDLLDAMAFEEYRLRLRAGESPTPAEYADRFGVEGGNWLQAEASSDDPSSRPDGYRYLFDSDGPSVEHAEMLRELDRTDPIAAESLAGAMSGFPRVGERFLGFELRGELGRGAFGRVYLARQGDLANRLVALKVSSKMAGESHALAQLQHTNVVPIYSVHRRGALQAVCMPYLGATTLADTLAVLKDRATPPRSGLELLSTHLKLDGNSKSTDPSDSSPDLPPTEPNPSPDRPTTLAQHSPPQVERLRKLSFVPAVLWLVERAADGLAHAHGRGILHRDLKPANILFADDGEPLLLDFNLSADTKVEFRASAALIGGTFPYMAPEQLRAFRDGEPLLDPRSDVYALGVILHELLTGSRPFPDRKGAVDGVLPEMLADRVAPLPDPRRTNPTISPAVASIVGHALEPDPDRRYQSADEFQEDLRRQLDNLPLRHAPERLGRERLAKWARRHPRVASSTTAGLVAAALVVALLSGFAVRHRQYQAVEASESARRLVDERREVVALLADPDADRDQVAEGLAACRGVDSRYRVLNDPSWQSRPLVAMLPPVDRKRLDRDMGELLVRWARVLARRPGLASSPADRDPLDQAARLLDRAEGCYAADERPRLLLLARAELARRSGVKPEEADRRLAEASSKAPADPRERLQTIIDRVAVGDRRSLIAFLDSASGRDPQDYSLWMSLAVAYVRVGQVESARQSYGVAIALAPRLFWPYYNRGLAALEARDYSAALSDFDQVVTLRPDLATPLVNRALARIGLGDVPGAVEDLDRCLAMPDAPSQAWFIRARAKGMLGDREGQGRDVLEGMKRPPTDEKGYVARGLARLQADPKGALDDFDAALALNPTYLPALQDKANVLAESLGRVDEAIKVLDVALKSYPTDVPALAGRGVLLARLGRRDAALDDARKALGLDDGALNLYQVAGIFALTSRNEPADVDQALNLLSRGIAKDPSWLAVVPKDSDLDPIRNLPRFRELIQALNVVGKAGAGPK